MKNLGEQMRDLKYLVSSENVSGSRGFYLTYAIVSVILLIAGIAGLVLALFGTLTGGLKILGFAILPVALIVIFGIMALCSRGD